MTINSDPQLNDADLELLSAYIDQQLDERERAVLEQRLGQEPGLRGVLDELRATVGLLHELEPIRPPRSFTIAAPAAAPRRFWSFPWRAIGSALVALVCLLTFSYALIRGSSNSGGAAAPAAAPAPAAMEAAAPTQAPAASGAAPSSAMRQLATADPAAALPAAAAPTAAPAAEAPTAMPAEAPAAPMVAADSAAPTAAPAAEAPMAAQAALASPVPTAAAASGAAPIATAPLNPAAPATAGNAAPTAAAESDAPTAAAQAPAGAALKSTEGPITQPYSSALVATSEISSPGTVTLDQPPTAPTANSAPSGGSSSWQLAVGIVVLVLLIAGGIGLALRRKRM